MSILEQMEERTKKYAEITGNWSRRYVNYSQKSPEFKASMVAQELEAHRQASYPHPEEPPIEGPGAHELIMRFETEAVAEIAGYLGIPTQEAKKYAQKIARGY